MTVRFTVRPTAASDIPAVIDLVKASWARTYDPVIGANQRAALSDAKHVPALFESEIGTPHGVSFVALDLSDAVIGHVGGDIRLDGVCFVDRLHVVPSMQGSGAAAALLDAVRAAAEGKAQALELTVLTGNGRAFGFYRKYGFEDCGDAGPEERLGDVGAILMRKPMRP